MVVLGQIWLYSINMVTFEQSDCLSGKVVVFGQKWLCSGKSGCIGVKVDVLG